MNSLLILLLSASHLWDTNKLYAEITQKESIRITAVFFCCLLSLISVLVKTFTYLLPKAEQLIFSLHQN